MTSTSAVWGIIVMMVVVAVLAYGVVKLRRARDEHRARSSERAAAMLLAMHQETARGRKPTAAAVDEPRSSAPAAAAVRHVMQRKPRLLDDRQRLLYLVLRAALPDHVVMANIRVADLIDADASPAYGERETRLRLLLQERIDCVVCSGDLAPLAAVMIHDAAAGIPEDRIKIDALRELGLKLLRFRSDNLPKPAEMRGLILG